MDIPLSPERSLPDSELRFETSRSAGPGGQNVNKVETRVTLVFDLVGSPSLTEDEKSLLRARLGRRVSRAGVVRVSSQRHRTQAANRAAAAQRFADLVSSALAPEPRRRRTRPRAGAGRRRVAAKRRRSEVKAGRRPPPGDE